MGSGSEEWENPGLSSSIVNNPWLTESSLAVLADRISTTRSGAFLVGKLCCAAAERRQNAARRRLALPNAGQREVTCTFSVKTSRRSRVKNATSGWKTFRSVRTMSRDYHEIIRKYAERRKRTKPRPPSQAPARPNGIEQVHFTMGGHDEASRVVGGSEAEPWVLNTSAVRSES